MNKDEKQLEPENIEKIGEYNLFIEFMAVPKAFRADVFTIRNEEDFGKKYGVHRNTLTTWKRSVGFQEKVDEKCKEWGRAKIPDVLASLFRTILKKGNKSEVQLWLEYFGGFTQKTEILSTIKQLDEKTEEKRKILEEWRNDVNIGESTIEHKTSLATDEPKGEGNGVESV